MYMPQWPNRSLRAVALSIILSIQYVLATKIPEKLSLTFVYVTTRYHGLLYIVICRVMWPEHLYLLASRHVLAIKLNRVDYFLANQMYPAGKITVASKMIRTEAVLVTALYILFSLSWPSLTYCQSLEIPFISSIVSFPFYIEARLYIPSKNHIL